ncbi:Protein ACCUMULATION AND REPLICATION OF CHLOROPLASTS 6, chloroplastic, partial [Tetrabaena socialis]
ASCSSTTRRDGRAARLVPGRGRSSRLAVLAFSSDDNAAPAHAANRSERLAVPVDYYQVSRAAPDAIRASYAGHMKHLASAYSAYSQDTQFSRAVLLKAGAEALADPELRWSYDAKQAAGHAALGVPGALVVLQEMGEYQLVLDLGARWLPLNGGQPDAGDVTVAMALAYCDRAGARLGAAEGSGGDAAARAGACEDLEAALSALRTYRVAQHLQAQIAGALTDLAPDWACELAALPLTPEHAERRAKGVAMMRGILRGTAADLAGGAAAEAGAMGSAFDGDGLAGVDDVREALGRARRLLKRGRDVLTSTEQVALIPDTLRSLGPAPSGEALYDAALAQLVDGYRNGWPHSVHQAEGLLADLQQHAEQQAEAEREQADLAAAAAARRVHYSGAAVAATPGLYHYNTPDAAAATMSARPAPQGQHAAAASAEAHAASSAGPHEGGGVALERCVCAVLLGEYQEAAELLGLAGSREDGRGLRAARPADPQLKAFVLASSPGGAQDLRQGLRALAARWLEGVGLASFRDTAGLSVPPLEATWFANTRVAVYVQVRRIWRNEQLLAAAHALANMLPNILRLLAAVAVRVAAGVVLAASRAQHLMAAAVGVGAAASPARAAAGATAVRGRQQEAAGPGAPEGRMRSSATRPAAPSHAGPVSSASPVGTVAAPAAAAALASAGGGPLGHPYGKAVREMQGNEAASGSSGPGAVGAAAPAAAPRAYGGAAAGGPHLRPPERYPRDASRAAAAAPTLLAADRQRHDDNTGTLLDTDHQLARSSAGPSAESQHRGRPQQQAPRAVHHGADEEEEEEEAGLLQRHAKEQELRAHLAGLEVAMWDSEVPAQDGVHKQVLQWSAGAVAVCVAFLTAGFRCSDARHA